MILEQLAKRGNSLALACLDAFDPDQPRDEKGMWTAGGASTYGAAAGEADAASGRARLGSGHSIAAALHNHAANLAPTAVQRGYHSKKASEHERTAWEGNEGTSGAHVKAKGRSELARGSGGSKEQAKLRTEADIEAALASGKTYESIHATGAKAKSSEPVGREAWNKHPFEMSKDPKTLAAIRADEIRERQIERGNDPERGVFRGVQKESTLRTTQVELPAIKEMPVSKMAPHTNHPSLLVGNAKDPSRMRTDENRRTQELPAVKEDVRQNPPGMKNIRPADPVAYRAARERDKAYVPTPEHQANIDRAKKENASRAAYEEKVAAMRRTFSSSERKAREQYSRQERAEPGAGARMHAERLRSGMSKEDRQAAAAASAGRWASRALETSAKERVDRIPSGGDRGQITRFERGGQRTYNLNNKYDRNAFMNASGRPGIPQPKRR